MQRRIPLARARLIVPDCGDDSLDTSPFTGCNLGPNQTRPARPRLRAARVDPDVRLEGWAGRLTPEWLAGDLTWFSGATQQEWTARRTP